MQVNCNFGFFECVKNNCSNVERFILKVHKIVTIHQVIGFLKMMNDYQRAMIEKK